MDWLNWLSRGGTGFLRREKPLNRRGDYIGTFTGKQFWPLDPRPGEVCLEDIAHALVNICRFNGHSNQFYSVAHHCLNVEMILKKRGFNKRIQLYGLLHDAAEAYIMRHPTAIETVYAGI